MELLSSVFVSLGTSVMKTIPITLGFALIFTAITVVARPCNSGQPWFRKPDLLVDLCYWFLAPSINAAVMISLLTAGFMAFESVTPGMAKEYVEQGLGPLSRLPMWAQAIAYMLLTDFILYWTHRLYHTMAFWRFHAIHHSSKDLEWISATRFHPGNLLLASPFANAVMLFAGISPQVMVMLAPLNIFIGALVHANLDWTFGPFRYVVASPVFHRWHHTAADRGGSMNFAGTFPFIDWMFGTFYMPKGELPDDFGVDDEHFPEDLLGQMLYPWLKRRRAQTAAAGTPAVHPAAE
jgi:sterol desaturase/sphingolipid hydroxylase (fatty acid hydroxylase superfamily)